MAEATAETNQETQEARLARELVDGLSHVADLKLAADPDRRSIPPRKRASEGVFYLQTSAGFFMLRRCETRNFPTDAPEDHEGTLTLQDFWVTDLNQRDQENWHLLWDPISSELIVDWLPVDRGGEPDEPMPLSVLADPGHCFVEFLASLKQGEGTILFSHVVEGVSEDISVPLTASPNQE